MPNDFSYLVTVSGFSGMYVRFRPSVPLQLCSKVDNGADASYANPFPLSDKAKPDTALVERIIRLRADILWITLDHKLAKTAKLWSSAQCVA